MRTKTILIVFIWSCSVLPITAQNNNEQADSVTNNSIVSDSITKKDGFLHTLFSFLRTQSPSKDDKLSQKAEELKMLQQQYDSLMEMNDSLIQIIKGFDAAKQRYSDSVSEKRVAQANESNAELIVSLNQRMDSICEVYVKGIFNAMMNYVIFSRYDSLAIQSQYELFDLMKLDKRIAGNKMKDKEFYYPRFKEYGVITRQISLCIDKTIIDIEAKTERIRAKEFFLSRIERTGYTKNDGYQYLDEIIEEAKLLFDDPKKYNVKEFEKLKKKLEPREW